MTTKKKKKKKKRKKGKEKVNEKRSGIATGEKKDMFLPHTPEGDRSLRKARFQMAKEVKQRD